MPNIPLSTSNLRTICANLHQVNFNGILWTVIYCIIFSLSTLQFLASKHDLSTRKEDKFVKQIGLSLYFSSTSIVNSCSYLWPRRRLPSPLFILFFCLFIYFFTATLVAYGGSQARGRIRTVAAGLHHSHSNAGAETCLWPTPQLTAMPDPLTVWARPGIKPTSSWLLVRFVSTEPWWEYPCPSIFTGVWI